MRSPRKTAPEIRREIQLSTLLESMPEGVLIVDADGTVLEVNSAAERFAHRSREELKGKNALELAKLVTIEEGRRPLAFPRYAITRALGGEHIRNERRTFRSVDGNGDPIEALVSANPIFDEGHIIGALVVIRDITELTQLQRRLNDTERHHAIGQMAAGLAHDFNNVLDTIEKAVTVLEMKAEAPIDQRKGYIHMIHTAVRRGAEIIARLRQYLKDGSSEMSAIDLRQLMQETIELTQPLVHETGKVRVETNLQPVHHVRGNIADLRRVLANLIINAVEAMPDGGTLDLRMEEQGGMVRVHVRDTGVGIPREQQKKIFYPYFTTKQSGTGLGLSGAQRIVLSYGGNIRVQSEPGKGTEFTIELPLIETRANGNGRAARTAKREEASVA